MQIQERSDGRYQFTLLTYLDKGSTKGLFTEILLYEDYFAGNARYAQYNKNQLEAGLPSLFSLTGTYDFMVH